MNVDPGARKAIVKVMMSVVSINKKNLSLHNTIIAEDIKAWLPSKISQACIKELRRMVKVACA